MLEGHTGNINDLEITRDGKRLISAGSDATVRLWDLTTGAVTVVEDAEPVEYVQLTPDDAQLIAVGEWVSDGPNGRRIVVRDLATLTARVVPRDGDTVTAGDAQLTWHAVDTTKYNFNLFHFAYALGKPTSNVLFWVVTIVNAPRDMPGVRLAIGSNAASVWWVNGEEVISLYNDRQAVIDDGVSKRLTLKEGPNVIRAVIINAGGATDYCARFLDAENNPVKGLTVKLDAQGKSAHR